MKKREKMVKEVSKLLFVIDEMCKGETFGAIVVALLVMMSKVLYHLPVDMREKVLVDLEKKIREGIELVPEFEEALNQDGKQSNS